jgi:photosystem II stability/assembly factor-like uncharacterized protein
MRSSAVVVAIVILTCVGRGQEVTLEWLNPSPTANSYFSLAVFDSLHVAALGYIGDVVRSSDGGVTWCSIGGNIDRYFVHRASAVMGDGSMISLSFPLLAQHPQTPTMIVKSVDSGRTWEAVYEHRMLLLAIKNYDGLLITSGYEGNVFVSEDGGTNWDDRHIATSRSVLDFSMHPSGRLVATGFDSLYVSADTGRSWSALAAKIPSLNQVTWSDDVIICMSRDGDFKIFSEAGTLLRERRFSNGSLFALQDQTIVVLDTSSAVTRDKGITWETYPQNLRHLPYNSMAFIGGTSLIAVGPSVARSSDGGRTWHDDSPLPRCSNSVICFINNDSGVVVAADGTVQRTLDGGTSWTMPTQLTDWPNGIVFLEEQGIIFLTTIEECYQSTDVGKTWYEVAELYTTDFKGIARLSPQSLAVATSDEIFLSGDAGRNWTKIPITEQYHIEFLEAISFADANFGAILSYGGRIHVTRDGGLTWTETGRPDPPFQSDGIECPGPGTIVTTGSIDKTAYMYESTDAGLSWRLIMMDVPPDPPIYPRFIDGVKSRASGLAMAVGGSAVYFRIHDRWISKYVAVAPLLSAAYPSDSVAYIAGDQGAILKARITGATTDVEVLPALPSNCTIVRCNPNPARDNLEIALRLSRGSSITLYLTDLIGRRLRVLHEGVLPAGESRINAMLGNLPSGVYRLLLTSPSGVDGRSVVVLR